MINNNFRYLGSCFARISKIKKKFDIDNDIASRIYVWVLIKKIYTVLNLEIQFNEEKINHYSNSIVIEDKEIKDFLINPDNFDPLSRRMHFR